MTLGFAGFARLQLQFEASGLALPILCLLVLGAGLGLFARRTSGDSDNSDAEPEPRTIPRWLALAVCGAGLALTFEGIARHARILSTGSTLDDDVFALVLLLSATLGALIFGPPLRSPAARRSALPVAAAMAALLGCLTLRSIGQLSSPLGWDRFIRQYELLSYHRGSGLYDLVLGGVLFTLPALALGTALNCARRLDWTALLFGAAAGLLSIPTLIGTSQVLPPVSEAIAANSAGLIPIGAILASCGGFIACLSTREAPSIANAIGASIALAALAASSFVPRTAVVICAPWGRRPILPTLVIESPEGLLTVEPTGGGIERVTLDRRVLAPGKDNAARDLRHLESTFEFLPKAQLESGALRVLLIGQLTPGRAIGLSRLPIASLDRAGAWHAAMPLLERHLFRAAPLPPTPGEILTPAAARSRYEAGQYDLVWIPLVAGPTPIADFDALGSPPAGTTAVAWISINQGAAQRNFPERGVLDTNYPSRLSVALVLGEGQKQLQQSRPGGFEQLELGSAGQSYSVFEDLRLHSHQRVSHATSAFSERLRLANQGNQFGPLTSALAHFYSIQTGSSPWANEAAATELDFETLSFLSDLTRAPDRTTKRWVEELAQVLIGQRRIDWLTEYVAPLAARWAPWPELELTLAEADLEGLLFEEALKRLTLFDHTQPQVALLRAKALIGLGRRQSAAKGLVTTYLLGGQAAELLRLPLAEILVNWHHEHALEQLTGLGTDLAQDERLIAAIESLQAGHDH